MVFRRNDDGGLRTFYEVDLRFNNIQMIDMHRQAFDLQAQHVELDNGLIDGCTPYEPLPIYSEQMPLRLHVTDSGIVRNSTIINCTSPYVVMAGLRYPDSDPGPIVHFENCLFSNNEYDRFEAEVVNYTDTPGWDPYVSGSFSSCLLREAPDVGANNLIGLDPIFDEFWGAPYLAADSPCIDGGNPDSAFNDIEDPANPGFALWPSQGSTLNDIGVTGGPRSAVIDTHWVDVKPNQWASRPQSFTLGKPYPNPFNPVTQVRFFMPAEGHALVRVFNLQGQLVKTLHNERVESGSHTVLFDGSSLASGLYLVEAGNESTRDVQKVMLVK